MPLTEATYYILLVLLAPSHGYGIMQRVEELTKGRLRLGAGTLYGVLNTLSDRRWISLYSEDEQSRKKKEYVITPLGEQILKEEMDRLEELLNNGRSLVRSNG